MANSAAKSIKRVVSLSKRHSKALGLGIVLFAGGLVIIILSQNKKNESLSEAQLKEIDTVIETVASDYDPSNVSETLKDLEQIIDDEKDLAVKKELRVSLATMQLASSEPGLAIETLENILADEGLDYRTLVLLGESYAQVQDYKNAIKSYEAAIEYANVTQEEFMNIMSIEELQSLIYTYQAKLDN